METPSYGLAGTTDLKRGATSNQSDEDADVAAKSASSGCPDAGSATPASSESETNQLNTENAQERYDPQLNFDLWTLSHFPRFLYMEAADTSTPLSSIKTIILWKKVVGITAESTEMKRLRNGSYIIEVKHPKYAENLLKTKEIYGVPVRVTLHRSLNTSKGLIFANHISNDSEQDIKEHSTNQGVIHVKQIISRVKGPTNAYILTFNTPKLPTSVKVAYMHCKVKTYIPSPTRCFKCQKFGHSTNDCFQKESVCGKCTEIMDEEHSYQTCQNTLKCRNCGGNHESSSRNCPEWKFQRRILEIKVTQNVTFIEAKKKAESEISPMQSAISNGKLQGGPYPGVLGLLPLDTGINLCPLYPWRRVLLG